MRKSEAILRIKSIQRGQSSGYVDFPEELKGNIAKRFWAGDWVGGKQDDFKYGFEYGEIFGLIEAFGITLEDLRKNK